jgi:translocator protein
MNAASSTNIPWAALAVTGAITLVVAITGGLLTEIGPWYRALKKPSFQPPDWLFGPAWTLIFTLVAVSAALAWRDGTPEARGVLVALFLLNAVLNVAWSGLFFKLRRPDWALIEVAFLWASIALLIARTWPINTTASLLLVPYLLWVSFASILNWAIVRLNG